MGRGGLFPMTLWQWSLFCQHPGLDECNVIKAGLLLKTFQENFSGKVNWYNKCHDRIDKACDTITLCWKFCTDSVLVSSTFQSSYRWSPKRPVTPLFPYYPYSEDLHTPCSLGPFCPHRWGGWHQSPFLVFLQWGHLSCGIPFPKRLARTLYCSLLGAKRKHFFLPKLLILKCWGFF